MSKLADFFIDRETGLPYDIAIGDELLPYEKNSQSGYGARFNVIVAKNGKFYHRSGCKCIKSRKVRIEHRYKAMRKFLPCPQCRPLCAVDYWYEDYLARSGEKHE